MTTSTPSAGQGQYQIRIKGELGPEWADWFDGLTLSTDSNGETVLSGDVADQAALHGLLAKIRDLGLTLLEVRQIPIAQGQGD